MKTRRLLLTLTVSLLFMGGSTSHAEMVQPEDSYTEEMYIEQNTLMELQDDEEYLSEEELDEVMYAEEETEEMVVEDLSASLEDQMNSSEQGITAEELIVDIDQDQEILEAQADRSESGLTLTFYANHNGVVDGGHCFLSVKNTSGKDVWIGEYILKNGKMVYIGARGGAASASSAVGSDVIADVGDGKIKGGAFFNFEYYADDHKSSIAATHGPAGDINTLYADYATITVPIQESELSAIYNYMKQFGGYNVLTNNCTTFAYNVWNALAPEEYHFPRSILEVVDQPSWAKEYILNTLHGEHHTSGLPLPENYAACFMVSPGGHLQPIDTLSMGQAMLDDPQSSSSDAYEQITATWKSVRMLIGVHDYNITGYDIEYYEKGHPQNAKTIRIDKPLSTSVVIGGLKSDTQYCVKVRTVNDQKDGWLICRGNYSPEKVFRTKKYTIKLNKTQCALYPQQATTLTASLVTDTNEVLNRSLLTWKSSNPKIATVSNGRVTVANTLGKATITAIYKGVATASCVITVKEPSIILGCYTTMYKGQSQTIRATVYGKSKAVTWKSSNKKVATISAKGVIKAKKKGTVTITAKANGVTKKVKITVLKPKIVLSRNSLTMVKGGRARLSAVAYGKKKTVKWSSSKKSIVAVDKYGNLIAKKKGTAVITAKANGVKAKCKVTVVNPKPVKFSFPSHVVVHPSSYTVNETLSSKAMCIPSLLVVEVSGNTVKFRLSIYNNYRDVFESRIVSDTITATVTSGKIQNATWKDSHGNAGKVTLTFSAGNKVGIDLTTTTYAYDAYYMCYLKHYTGVLGTLSSDWDECDKERLWRW